MDKKPNYYAILTADVRYDKELSSTAKLLYAEITALSNSLGYCCASNKYFADLYGLKIRQIQYILSQLSEKEYIRVETSNGQRKIFITGVQKNAGEYAEKCMLEGAEKCTHNNTSINNKFNIVCSEVLSDNSEPPIITLTLNNKSEYPITAEYFKEMQSLYPNVDVMRELRKMRAWCINNPTRRKTSRGIKKFINSWLSSEQDKGSCIKRIDEDTRRKYECVNEGDIDGIIGFTVE